MPPLSTAAERIKRESKILPGVVVENGRIISGTTQTIADRIRKARREHVANIKSLKRELARYGVTEKQINKYLQTGIRPKGISKKVFEDRVKAALGISGAIEFKREAARRRQLAAQDTSPVLVEPMPVTKKPSKLDVLLKGPSLLKLEEQAKASQVVATLTVLPEDVVGPRARMAFVSGETKSEPFPDIKIRGIPDKPPAGIMTEDIGPKKGLITDKGKLLVAAIRAKVREEPNFFKKARIAFRGVGQVGRALETEKPIAAAPLIAAGTAIDIGTTITEETIRGGPLQAAGVVAIGSAEFFMKPQEALITKTPTGKVSELIGVSIFGETVGRAIPATVKAAQKARFEKKIQLKPEQKTPILILEELKGEPAPIGEVVSRPIEPPVKRPKEIQVAFRKDLLDIPKAKEPTNFISKRKIEQKKLDKVRPEAFPEISFRLTTETGKKVSQVRSTTQTRFFTPSITRPKPDVRTRRIQLEKAPQFETLSPTARERAVERALGRGKLLATTDPLSASIIGLKVGLEIAKEPTIRLLKEAKPIVAREIRAIKARAPITLTARPSTQAIAITPTTTRISALTPVQKNIFGRRPTQDVISGSVLGQVSLSKQAAAQAQRQRQQQKQAQDLAQGLRVKTKLKPKLKLKVAPPVTILAGGEGLSRGKLLKSKQKRVPAYDTFVKEKGSFKRVNKKPLPINMAHNLGFDVVDNTPTKTFKTIRRGSTKLKDDPFKRGFNKLRAKGKTLIERTRYGIDTVGELQGITVKGYMARRRKSRRFI